MQKIVKNCKIKIMKEGPYTVSGSVPLEEKVIVYKDYENHYVGGQPLPQMETYALCRCGYSKNLPFCDGSHSKVHFDGTETASKEPYLNQAESVEGPDLMLTDTEEAIESAYKPSIVILQDPAKECSGPIWVRGGIPIESSDGSVYEIRNRVTLCRCGESENKPFCDAAHVTLKFNDKKIKPLNIRR